jgi:hypothetical protein
MKKHTVNESSAQPWVDRFGELPAIGEAIYAVNPAVPTLFLFSEAQFLLDSMAEIASDGVRQPMSAAAAWMLESNVQRLGALLGCIEAQVSRVNAGVLIDQREAA